MTENKDRAHVSSDHDGLVADQWDDYAIVSRLTDKEHKLPDWILRLISGQKRQPRVLRGSTGLAKGLLRELKENPTDVNKQWLFIFTCYEIGLKQVISEYQSQTNGVEEGDQPS